MEDHMSLSRKRRRELKKLRKLANHLANEQREVLGHAGEVLNEAGQQARKLGNEHLVPRVETALQSIRPGVETGVDIARGVSRNVRRAAAPYAASALARTINMLEKADNKDAAKRLQRYGEKQGLLKRRGRVGGVIALILGGVAAAAVGYSLWQAFREDDELWVAPEQDSQDS
jgi:hypothetical protein